MNKICIFILLLSILTVTLSDPNKRDDRRRVRARPGVQGGGPRNERNQRRSEPGSNRRGTQTNRREPTQTGRRNSRHQSSGNEGKSSSQSSGSRYRTPAEYLQKPVQLANRVMAYMGEKALVPLEKTYNTTGSLINRLKPTIQEARDPMNTQRALIGDSGQEINSGVSSNGSPLVNVGQTTLNIGSFKLDGGSQVQRTFGDPSFIDWSKDNDKAQAPSASGVQSVISLGT